MKTKRARSLAKEFAAQEKQASAINKGTALLDPAHRLNARELATVLAALRYWQREGFGRSLSWGHEHDIASDGGIRPLDHGEIDDLCERLNCAPCDPDASHGARCAQRFHGAAECTCGKAEADAAEAEAPDELLEWRKQLREELADMGFGDPDMAVDGGDAVEYLGKLYDDLEQMIGKP